MTGNGKEKKKYLSPQMFLEMDYKDNKHGKIIRTGNKKLIFYSNTRWNCPEALQLIKGTSLQVTTWVCHAVTPTDCLQVVSPSNVRQRNHDKKR